jgi:acyl-CoA synthetase (AMP-forming)/AMP-acid ligase II
MFNIISLLHEHISKNPRQLAFKGKDFEISYIELTEKISSIGHYLKNLGLKRGDRVLIFIPLSLDLYAAMFAVQQIGAIAVFLDSWARKDQLKMCVDISEAKAMISLKQALQIPEIQNIPLKLNIEDLNTVEKAACPIQSVSPKETALITFTTGSSGTPKGANRTHAFLEAQANALKKVIPYAGQELDLPVFPIFALNNLASGITTLLPQIDLAAPSLSDGEILTHQILSQSVDCTTLSPSLFIAVANYCDQKSLQLPSLKRVVTGGAPISRDNVKQFKKLAPNAKIFVLYGSTEVEPIAHIEAEEMLQALESGEGVNVGPIADGLDYKLVKITKEPIEVVDWGQWEVGLGEVGELIVSGTHVCEGYYNDEVSFARAKIREQNGKIWHRTGDVGFFDQDYFWFVGRVHNVIYRKGALLFPLKAELLMKKFPEVKQAAFLGVGEETVAVISLKSERQGLLVEMKARLEANGIPVDQIRIMDTIPMDPRHHSKVEYEQLRKLL